MGKAIPIGLGKTQAHLFKDRQRLPGILGKGLPESLRGIQDFRLLMEDSLDPAQAYMGPGQQENDHLSHEDIKKNQDGVFGHSGDVADLHMPLTDPVSSQPDNAHHRKIDSEKGKTVKPREKAVDADSGTGVILEGFSHTLLLEGFFVKGADDPHAGEAFPNHGVHLIQKPLQPLENKRGFFGDKSRQGKHQSGDPKKQKAHARIGGKGHDDAQDAHDRNRQNHLDTPDHRLLHHVNVA